MNGKLKYGEGWGERMEEWGEFYQRRYASENVIEVCN